MKSSRKFRLVSAVLFSLGALAFSAHAALSYAGDGKVQFEASGPGGLTIEGHGATLNVSEAGGVITFTSGLKGLKTGIDMRDEHLQKALGTSTHATATLKVKRSDIIFPEDNAAVDKYVTGELTLHGVTKPLKVHYHVKRTGSDYHFQGLGTVNIENHGIEQPCYLGVCVDPNVKLKVKGKVRE